MIRYEKVFMLHRTNKTRLVNSPGDVCTQFFLRSILIWRVNSSHTDGGSQAGILSEMSPRSEHSTLYKLKQANPKRDDI